MEMKKLFAAIAAVSAFGLTACGSDSDSSSSNDSTDSNLLVATTSTYTAGDACATVGSFTGLDILMADGSYKPYCELSGSITENATLTTDFVYKLSGYVTVGNGNGELEAVADAEKVTLTVEPGVHFRSTDRGSLVISRGSELVANGTADAPIVMSSQDEGYADSGEWGGLVLQGFAQNNQCQEEYANSEICNTDDEAGTGFHGGSDDTDSSGSISYLIVAEGGYEVAADSEVNGITLHSVGYGTTIENVMVYLNADDGVEFFGGAASIKNLILVDNGDESIDWDDGYRGNIQFALVRQGVTQVGDHGIEADTRGISTDAVLDSDPVLTNITFQASTEGSDDLFRFKEGTNGTLTKIAADNYVDGFLVEDADTNVIVSDVLIEFSGVATTFKDGNTNSNLTGWSDASTSVEVTLGDMFEVTSAGAIVTASTATANNGQSGFFVETDYIGAVDPDATEAWYAWAEAVVPAAFQ